MNSPVISLSGIHVSYGNREVVSDISLDIPHGCCFGLIGLNGVGKTTLIKAMTGLRTPSAGTALIDGRNPATVDGRKGLAYLPERFDPPAFLKGFEFLRFSQRLYGLAADNDEAAAFAKILDLDPAVLGNRVHTYSKGMRQKLGLLSVLLTRCPLLVLDEPMSGLDPRARGAVREALMQVRAQGRSVFLSSHILADMTEICDRVGVIHAGRLVFEGSPAQLMKAGNDSHNMEKAFLNVLAQDKAA